MDLIECSRYEWRYEGANELNAKHKAVILAMAGNNMKVADAAAELHYDRNTVNYHIKQIKNKYGLSPKNFYDLNKLISLANEDSELVDDMIHRLEKLLCEIDVERVKILDNLDELRGRCAQTIRH